MYSSCSFDSSSPDSAADVLAGGRGVFFLCACALPQSTRAANQAKATFLATVSTNRIPSHPPVNASQPGPTSSSLVQTRALPARTAHIETTARGRYQYTKVVLPGAPGFHRCRRKLVASLHPRRRPLPFVRGAAETPDHKE